MIQEIELSKLRVHPKNVRKTYSDIAELADSIRSQGILQNLTVVKNPEEEGIYWVVIGNRRLMAARKAGLKTAPCQVVEMDEKDQASTMLLENMQRSDLTIHEQAYGIQMVLDLGETEASLAEKTGLSKTTIHHRSNIAKLNQDVLQEKENDESFQLTLRDLYELERIPDIKIRDKILKEAFSSNNLAQKAKEVASEISRKKNEKAYIELCEADGIKPAPEKAKNELWNGKWETIKTFDLDDEPKKKTGCKTQAAKEDLFYLVYWREFRIIKRNPKKEPTEYELQQKARDKKKREIKAMQKVMSKERLDFVKLAIEKKFKPENGKTEGIIEQLFEVIIKCGAWMNESVLLGFITGEMYIDSYSDEGKKKKADYERKRNALSLTYKMMIYATHGVENNDLTDWTAKYSKETGAAVTALDEVLEQFGFSYSREDFYKIADGSHELYVKEE